MDYVTIASTGNAADYGDLSMVTHKVVAVILMDMED